MNKELDTRYKASQMIEAIRRNEVLKHFIATNGILNGLVGVLQRAIDGEIPLHVTTEDLICECLGHFVVTNKVLTDELKKLHEKGMPPVVFQLDKEDSDRLKERLSKENGNDG